MVPGVPIIAGLLLLQSL